MKCEDCKWWHDFNEEDNPGQGECRKLSPCRIWADLKDETIYPSDNGIALWPETSENDWCGEFESKENDNISDKIKKLPIAILRLTSRPRNALDSAKLEKIEDLLKYTENDLKSYKFRGIGKKSVEEIQQALDYELHIKLKKRKCPT